MIAAALWRGGLATGCAYLAVQCVLAAVRPGSVEWTIGYWLFAAVFTILAVLTLASLRRLDR